MTNAFQKQTIAVAINEQLQNARLRILIVGAGIAGATLGALLRQRGEPAAMIERRGREDAGGYMLGLMPLGGRVLNGLGLRDDYIASSQPMQDYVMHGRKGQEIRRYPMQPIIDKFGLYRGIERGPLINLLRRKAGSICYEASATAIKQNSKQAEVTFCDGSSAHFDLVIIADGIHSHTRGLAFGREEFMPFDTGWGGFVAWCATQEPEARTYREFWSNGWGIGMYPVLGRTGLFLAGRHDEIAKMNSQDYVQTLLAKNPPEPFKSALNSIDRATPAIYWPMTDGRSKAWHRVRTVLLGDAAAAFLPTAGVGASAAMDSAAALADELSRAGTDHMAYALSLYEKRQRHRVEMAQQNSRKLSGYMFVNSASKAFLRDQVMRFYSMEQLLKDISRVMGGGR